MISSLRTVTRAEEQARKATVGGTAGVPGRDHTGRNLLLGGAAVAGAHRIGEFGKESLVKYREQDNQYRYLRAVADMNEKQAQPFLDQAISGSANSKYNDIEWLKTQRNLLSKGLTPRQVLSITPSTAHVGQAMGISMDEAANLMEGGMFGFNKERNTENAKEAADRIVKASKVSGMDADDIKQIYKYGAAPARLAGISEPTLLGFGAMAKKSNMGGDEAGVAFRALTKNLYSPTRDAQRAMAAAGIDYSQYQYAPKQMDVEGFIRRAGIEYGKEFDPDAQNRLRKIFANQNLTSDPVKYGAAVTDVLQEQFPGREDAQTRKSLAGLAQSYRNASVGGVDANRLMNDIEKHGDNLQLMNAIFGSKQGGRLASVFGDDPEFKRKIDQINTDSAGYASRISDERMAGFDGAVSRFESAVMNMQTAIGRSFDKTGPNGEPGTLTNLANIAGKLAQGFAELDSRTVQATATLGAIGALWGGAKGVSALAGGFGLSTSAKLLDEAAMHLMGVGGGVPGTPGGGKGRGFRRGLGGRLLHSAPIAATAAELADWAHDTEKAHGGGQQPGADSAEGYDSILGSPRPRPFVPEAPKQYDAFKDALEEHRRASQPGWTVSAPQKAFPMTGAGGATAGVEGPAFPGLTGGVDQIGASLQSGAGQASAAGASTAQAYHEGLVGQLQQTLSAVQSIVQQIMGTLDFSASPHINSTGDAGASAPRRQSSLGAYDHGRASASSWVGGPST